MQTITFSRRAHKLVVSQNETDKAATRPSSQFDKLLIANTSLAVWLIFLAIGGGITALYYAQIGYLPEIEWQSVLIYLFIGTVVGGTLGLLLPTSIFIPGVLWSELIIFDRRLQKYFAYDTRSEEPCIRSVIFYLGVPYAGILLISHVMLLVQSAFKYWLAAAGVLLVTFWLMRLRFECIMLRNSRAYGTNKLQTGKDAAGKSVWELLRPCRKFRARQTFKY